jgi:hypothetical protein
MIVARTLRDAGMDLFCTTLYRVRLNGLWGTQRERSVLRC